ncbi:hypothetical protein OCK74_16035 [Chitinophagaceae bacterium LB-8]|uniref:Uncharacterized protein n=1 Tax=Paraflavisolibacter caeni TaxID=2982496 RepID=A0A9X3BGB1_9BACT|nr:hypothetical protein [Paraflavisolibacter caeni]MCU7550629.1 hypothetical protein [Paraflavisolibacter caeni]
MTTTLHRFHIPVMGLAYTVDSPVKVARFGIASTISIIEDGLIEMMRRYYYPKIGETYVPITPKEDDCRAKRITDYLNLVNRMVNEQVEKLKTAAFEAGSEIVQYFEMLPEDSKLKQLYVHFIGLQDKEEKEKVEALLRAEIKAGAIDVNIMTKVDKNNLDKAGNVIEEGSDALASLKGYAKSNLSNSSLIFSAGMNPRLYNYLEKFTEFDAKGLGQFDKKIVIKVSDYRSALIQGKYLAKKGFWVSEFRIESGLNCGGHAFATDGYLLGPIMEEFKNKKEELSAALFQLYNAAVKAKGGEGFSEPHPIKITVQGGIGTFEEDDFLKRYYNVDATGWGTPFLLVPEATTVDQNTLQLLSKAGQDDIFLSKNSPLGVRFHYLKGTSSDLEKAYRISKGKPGSPCTEKQLVSNTEFTKEPICTASLKYQRLKMEQLKSLNLPEAEYNKQLKALLDKECLCVGLSNAASKKYEVPFLKNQDGVTICPGPNIAYFTKIASLAEMVGHIYGRTDLLGQVERPNLFINELVLYINYLVELVEEEGVPEPGSKRAKYFTDFYKNLQEGVSYYRQLAASSELAPNTAEKMNINLDEAEAELKKFYSTTLEKKEAALA